MVTDRMVHTSRMVYNGGSEREIQDTNEYLVWSPAFNNFRLQVLRTSLLRRRIHFCRSDAKVYFTFIFSFRYSELEQF